MNVISYLAAYVASVHFLPLVVIPVIAGGFIWRAVQK